MPGSPCPVGTGRELHRHRRGFSPRARPSISTMPSFFSPACAIPAPAAFSAGGIPYPEIETGAVEAAARAPPSAQYRDQTSLVIGLRDSSSARRLTGEQPLWLTEARWLRRNPSFPRATASHRPRPLFPAGRHPGNSGLGAHDSGKRLRTVVCNVLPRCAWPSNSVTRSGKQEKHTTCA